jgi:hypothetical protein
LAAKKRKRRKKETKTFAPPAPFCGYTLSFVASLLYVFNPKRDL